MGNTKNIEILTTDVLIKNIENLFTSGGECPDGS